MDTTSRSRTETLKNDIQRKIQTVLAEFADGTLSREQFHAIYAHYSNQLTILEAALNLPVSDDTQPVGKPNETIAIRTSHMGKALGLVIYHHKSGMFVETLGQFDVPPSRLAPTLNDFSLMIETNKLIDRRVEKIGMKQWLMFAPGRYTTIVTLFHNEPSPHQIRELERLHHDFEVANTSHLAVSRVDPSKLAYPFLVFVQQKLKRP